MLVTGLVFHLSVLPLYSETLKLAWGSVYEGKLQQQKGLSLQKPWATTLLWASSIQSSGCLPLCFPVMWRVVAWLARMLVSGVCRKTISSLSIPDVIVYNLLVFAAFHLVKAFCRVSAEQIKQGARCDQRGLGCLSMHSFLQYFVPLPLGLSLFVSLSRWVGNQCMWEGELFLQSGLNW